MYFLNIASASPRHGFRSGDPGGVAHQFTPCCSKKIQSDGLHVRDHYPAANDGHQDNDPSEMEEDQLQIQIQGAQHP